MSRYGDAFVYANSVTVFVNGRPPVVIPLVDPPTDWHDLTEKAARPALLAAGWHLNDWHHPPAVATSVGVLAVAFTWKD